MERQWQKQFGNKEQIKTIISIASCNLVALNHKSIGAPTGEAKFWQDQVERKI